MTEVIVPKQYAEVKEAIIKSQQRERGMCDIVYAYFKTLQPATVTILFNKQMLFGQVGPPYNANYSTAPLTVSQQE